jgi:flagellar hook assembly protein FlgD
MLPSIFQKPLFIKVTKTDIHDAVLRIYDISGRCVKKLDIDNMFTSSGQNLMWDGYNDSGELVPSGVLFIELSGKNCREVKKTILVN